MFANKWIVLPFLLYGLTACNGPQKPVDMTRSSSKKGSPYEITSVTEKALASMARMPGQLKPYNEVNIFPKVNGFVQQIYVDRGSIVKKGQLLITLEAPEMYSQLEATTSKYLQAQVGALASKEKYQRLLEAAAEPGAVSPLELDNALSKMKADQALALSEKSNVASVKTMQDYLRIRAPFDGMIVQRNVSPGALVSPGKATDQPMLILQDIHRLRLEVYIPEDYVDKVDLKQSVRFTFNALPGQEQKAMISRSSNALGSMRSEAIEIDVSNPGDVLKPGMYAEVKISMLSGKKSLLVPNNAMVRSTEREYVVAVDRGKAFFVDVKEGMASHDSTEVFGKLKSGQPIVKNANDEIKEGTALE